MGSASFLQRFRSSKIFTLLMLLAGLIAMFSIWAAFLPGKNFLQTNTFVTILNSIVVTSFLSVGASFLMVSGNIDLSASTIGAFAGMLMGAALVYWGFPWWAAILVALIAAGLFGAFNAVLVNEFRFQPFIATMAMSSVIKGLTYLVSMDPKSADPSASTIVFNDAALTWIGSYNVNLSASIQIPVTIFLTVLAFAVYGIILARTRFGMQMYLCGGNPQAARLSGIKPRKISYILFINCAMMGGLSGIILACRTRQAQSLALSANMFTGMTAAMLGGISFGGGSGGMGGAFVGMLILNTFSQGLVTVNFSAFWTTVFSGLLLIAALALDLATKRRVK
jgi:ribose/xylose/arabinose/galactoside ABC-type transport system permease subunit